MNACRVELARLKEQIAALQAQAAAPEAELLQPVATPGLDMLVVRPRVGVGCVLVSPLHPGCLLIGERQGSHGAGHWALPGGHLEQNESFAECASKEIVEECGIEIDQSAWTTLFLSNDPMPEEALHYVTIFQIATISDSQSRSIVNSEPTKCKGWDWVPFNVLSGLPTFIPLKNFLARNGIDLITEYTRSQASS